MYKAGERANRGEGIVVGFHYVKCLCQVGACYETVVTEAGQDCGHRGGAGMLCQPAVHQCPKSDRLKGPLRLLCQAYVSSMFHLLSFVELCQHN